MLIRKRRGWEIPEREVTPESIYLNRRKILQGMGLAAIGAGGAYGASKALANGLPMMQGPVPMPDSVVYPSGPAADLYPAAPHPRLTLEDAGRPLTDPALTHAYNNFYEFETPKQGVWRNVDKFETEPWTFEVSGLVSKPGTYDLEEVMRKMPLEERVCRFRCVERWAAVVPWSGFPFRSLLELVEPQPQAKYVGHEDSVPARPDARHPVAVVVPVAVLRWPDDGGGEQRAGVPGHGLLRQAEPETERRAAALHHTLEVRLQTGEIDRQLRIRRAPAAHVLERSAAERIRISGPTSTRAFRTRAGRRQRNG